MHIPQTKTTVRNEAKYYIRAIRNEAKREYAELYAAWLDGDRQTPEPERPAALSVMGAQAVRLNLYEYDYETR